MQNLSGSSQIEQNCGADPQINLYLKFCLHFPVFPFYPYFTEFSVFTEPLRFYAVL